MPFSNQTSSSPITAPHSNIKSLAYLDSTIYYTTGDDQTKIFAMDSSGTAVSSKEITLSSSNAVNTNETNGLCTDGTDLYLIGGAINQQVINKYRVSDRSYQSYTLLGFPATRESTGIEHVNINGTNYLLVLADDGRVYGYTTDMVQNLRTSRRSQVDFTLPATLGVEDDWFGLCYDSITDSILVSIGHTPTVMHSRVIGFDTRGVRRESEDLNLSATAVPEGITYDSANDVLYLTDSGSSVLGYGESPRWNLAGADLNITEGSSYTLDISQFVTAGSTITLLTDLAQYIGMTYRGTLLEWASPTAPDNGLASQMIPVSFRATLGANTADALFNLRLTSASRTIAPQFVGTGIPEQTVYEPYTPPMGAITPSIPHGFTITLSNYLLAGTQPVNFVSSRSSTALAGRFQITGRYVAGVVIHDVLVYNSGPVESDVDAFINVVATNSAGRDSIAIEVMLRNASNF